MAAGYWRAYGSPEDSFWCCTGTGAEDFAKFGDTIYYHRGETLYVNQFIASVLTWNEKAFTLRQETQFPSEAQTKLTVELAQPQTRSIAIRIPSWVGDSGSVAINGRPLDAFAEPGSYLVLRRLWRSGDTITVHLPMALREEELPGSPTTVARSYGPLVLAGVLGNGPTTGAEKIITGRPTAPGKAGPPAPLPQVQASQSTEWLQAAPGKALQFSAQQAGSAIQVVPMYQIRDQKYTVYWQKA